MLMQKIRRRNPETIEVVRNCKNCGDTFSKLLFKSSIKYGHNATYCNMECMVAYMKSNSFNFPCLVCKTPIFVQPAQVKYGRRSTCKPECRRILARQRAEQRRKDLGYTKHQLDRLARYSPEAIEWRKKVFERDDYTCQDCGVRGTYLEADHIKPWAYFPELRFELSNGRTLCRPCHDKTKIGYKKMREEYKKLVDNTLPQTIKGE